MTLERRERTRGRVRRKTLAVHIPLTHIHNQNKVHTRDIQNHNMKDNLMMRRPNYFFRLKLNLKGIKKNNVG